MSHESPHAMWKDSATLQAVLCSDPTQTATRELLVYQLLTFDKTKGSL